MGQNSSFKHTNAPKNDIFYGFFLILTKKVNCSQQCLITLSKKNNKPLNNRSRATVPYTHTALVQVMRKDASPADASIGPNSP